MNLEVCSLFLALVLLLQCNAVKNKSVFASTLEFLAFRAEFQTVKIYWVYTDTTKDQTEETRANFTGSWNLTDS